MKNFSLKVLALAVMGLFTFNAMAETENNPSDADKDVAIVGTSYTISGTFIAGKGGTMAGTMTEKGIKFRINKTHGETKNAVPFTVNEGYQITAISCDGHVNDNTKTSTINSVYVDGTAIDFTAVTLPNKTSSIPFAVNNISAKKEVVFVFDGAASQANIQYTITYASLITTDNANLASISVNGDALEGFEAGKDTYTVELPYGTTTVPTIVATSESDKANIVVNNATSLEGQTTIVVTAEDGTTTKTYTLSFSVATAVSNDATLASLSVAGKAIEGFKADSLSYSVELAYTDELAIVAEPNFSEAQIGVVLPETLPGEASVVVTAQDGTTTQTYTIALTRKAPRLYQAIFDNGFDAYITNSSVEVYYAGTKPSFTSGLGVSGEGTTATFSEDVITISGANGAASYTVNYHEITPLTTDGTVTFDSTETYIASVYGWDATKGWKFAKSVEEESNRRVSAGKNRIHFFFGPASKVDFTWAVERDIKVYVNGVESTITEIENGFSVSLNTEANNVVAIVSNQTKGDGGVSGLTLTTSAPSADPSLTLKDAQNGVEDDYEYLYYDLGTVEEGQSASVTVAFEAKNIPATCIMYNEDNEEVEEANYIQFAMAGDALLFDITVSENASVVEGWFGQKQYTFPVAADGSVSGSITISLKKDLGGMTITDLGEDFTYGDIYSSVGWGFADRTTAVMQFFNVQFALSKPAEGGDDTALEDAVVEGEKAQKVIENGVVYIIKNGVKYTVLGNVVK